MRQSEITEIFVNFIDDYKKDKFKELAKDIVDTLEKNLDVTIDSYKFNQTNIVWADNIREDYEKWEKFKQDKDFTKEKLEDRISKKLKEFLNDEKITFNVVNKLKSIKHIFGLTTFRGSLITFSKIREWLKKFKDIEYKYNYANWLDWASENAKNIGFATHVAKLTHSSIKGATNIYFENGGSSEFLSTSSLANKEIEVSQTNNALAPIGKFIQLSSSKESFSEIIKKGDLSDFLEFSKNNQQLEKWKNGFTKFFLQDSPSCHSLLKQMYFPISDDYHMLSPMVSSSLDQEIFKKIQYYKYKESKENRDQKKANKYHGEFYISYPNISILKITASNHGNASPLNGKRGGIRYLFPSTPPQWKSTTKLPLKQSSLFWGEYDRRIWRSTKELKEYLLKLQDKKTDMYIKNSVKRSINYIIDTLFDYVAEIQNMRELKGWSAEAKNLKESHKLWLDPYRDDEEFQRERKEGEWIDEVCLDFGLWLNKKLEDKKMVFAKIQSDRWAKLLKKRLRIFENELEEIQ